MERKPADELKEIAYQMRHGMLTYEQGHQLAAPIVAKMNERARKLAKEHGVPFRKITFTSFIR